jgi:hypothetical protein
MFITGPLIFRQTVGAPEKRAILLREFDALDLAGRRRFETPRDHHARSRDIFVDHSRVEKGSA